MDDTIQPPVGWRDLAEAFPGDVGVHAGGEFVHVSEGFAAAAGVGADALAGEHWSVLFDRAEAERLEGAVERARQGGRWDGEAQVGGRHGDGRAVGLTLSGAGRDALVWVIADRDPPSGEEDLRRQRTLIQAILNTVPDVIFAYDEDGEHVVEDALLDEFAGYPKEELAGMGLLDFMPEEDRAAAREHIRRARTRDETVSFETAIVTKDGDRIPHEYRAASMELEGETIGVAAAARDITERLERERELERRRDELTTLDRINELLLETVRELVQTSSRDAVERAVCERLVASDLYQFAWVGEREFDGDRIVPRVTAGDDHGYLEVVTVTDDRSETGRGPAGRAMRTGEVQVANVDDPAFEPWRAAASERGVESTAAVPLHRGDTVYGVLVVYATREDAFREREQAGFDVLGRTVGSVIHAARNRELLFADAVVEIEFDLAAPDPAFPPGAAGVDCELSLDGYVPSGERWILYGTVAGARPGTVIEAAAGSGRIERARVVSEDDDGGRVELVVPESPLLRTVTAMGATVETAVSRGGGCRLVVEAPVDADVREIVQHVLGEYPGAELLACQERDREVTGAAPPRGMLGDLTDRQREVLEAAYRAGYFDWPRESTAEEVADALGITPPTLHAHLRKAEGALLAELF